MNQSVPQSDRRRLLKIKLKSLATEAKIIRLEESKARYSKRPEVQAIREEMYHHRIDVVRFHSRSTGLAYGFIRGRKYRDIEARGEISEALWNGVMKRPILDMIHKYGPQKIPAELLDQWLRAEPMREKPPQRVKPPYVKPAENVVTLHA
jgi:hypothetical protein